MPFCSLSTNARSSAWLGITGVIITLLTLSSCCRRNLQAALDPIGFIPDAITTPQPVAEAPLPLATPLSLSAGARPIVLQVSKAPAQLVTRSVLTWGYNDPSGRFVSAGNGTFDHRGGVLSGELKADVPVDAVQTTLTVDYTNPQLSDLTWQRKESVGSAGVNHIFDVTSARVQTLVLFDVPQCGIDEQDHLIFTWRFQATSAPAYTHAGVMRLQYADLERARGLLIRKQFDLPLRQRDDGMLHWTLSGSVRKQPLHRTEGSLAIGTPSLRLTFSDDGSVLVR